MKNNKRYIGQHRYSDEKDPMCYYSGSGILIKKAIKKYGIENFKKEVLYMRIKTQETANAMEIWAIEKYKPEYNIAKGGGGVSLPKGYRHMSEETRRKLSQSLKGKNKGKYVGRKLTDEWKKHIGEAEKGHPQYNKNPVWNKGMKMSDEYKQKLSEAHKGKRLFEETKRRMSEALKGRPGRPHSDEIRKKLSESHKGKHWKLVDGKRVYY